MKKMKYLLILIVCMFTLGSLIACDKGSEGNNSNDQDTVPPSGGTIVVPPSGGGAVTPSNPPSGGEVVTPPTVDVEKVTFEDATVEYTGEAISFVVKNLPGGVYVEYVYLLEGEEVAEMVEIGEYEVTATIRDKATGDELRVLTAILTIEPVKIYDEIPNDADANIELTYTTTFMKMQKDPDNPTQLIAAGLELYATENIYFVLDRNTAVGAVNVPLKFIELDEENSVECASIVDNCLVISEAGEYDVIMTFPEGSLVPVLVVREGADNSLFYFRGTVNNFEASEEYLFVKDETNTTATFEIELKVGDEFKVANYYYSVSFDFNTKFVFLDGFSAGSENGNVKVDKAGLYKFVVNLDSKTLTVYRDSQELIEDRNVLYVRGTITTPAWDSLSLILGKNNGISVIELQLKVGDAFKVADATWTAIYDYGYFNSATTHFGSDKDNNIVVKVAGTYKIEVDTAGNKVSVYCDGTKIVDNATSQGGGSQGGGAEVGTVMYRIVINGTQQIDLIYEGKWNYDDSYDQHHAFKVTLNAGDIITFINASNGETWTDMTVDPASTGGMTLISGTGIKVGTSGVYDLYVKTKFQADNIYFGPAA